jgi:hypothetical protein
MDKEFVLFLFHDCLGQCGVVWYNSADVSEKHFISIFGTEE